MKTKISLELKRTILTIFLFICASLFMHNFYKTTLGFIANNFQDGLTLITIMTSYLVPVLCFICFFINHYIKSFNKLATIIYSSLVILTSIFCLYGIFTNIDLYISNNILGVYTALPSIILLFPFDGILIHLTLIVIQIFNLLLVFKPNHKLAYLKNQLNNHNYFNLKWYEMPFVIIISLFTFFTVGDFICGLNLIENIFYDIKYLFLLLWVLLMPLFNLLCLLFKVETKISNQKNKVVYLLTSVSINVLFIALFFIFEALYPNYIANIGKPLFPITYSISLPLEMMIILGIQGFGCLVSLTKLVISLVKKNQPSQSTIEIQ